MITVDLLGMFLIGFALGWVVFTAQYVADRTG